MALVAGGGRAAGGWRCPVWSIDLAVHSFHSSFPAASVLHQFCCKTHGNGTKWVSDNAMRAKDDLIDSYLCQYIESLLSPYLEESALSTSTLIIRSHMDGMYYDCQAITTLRAARSLQLQPAVS
jgi:hypothetical protein